MEYSDQIVKFIYRVIGGLMNNTMEKGASFLQRYFLNRGLKKVWTRRALFYNTGYGLTLQSKLFYPISIK